MTLPATEIGSHGPAEPELAPVENREVTGRSPLRIAFERLRRDPVAVVSFLIVLVFVLIAVFAGTIAKFFGVTTDTVSASSVLEFPSMLPKTGPPNHGFDSNHPFGIAPQSGEDNLATWLFGARTSLLIAAIATFAATFIGVVLGLIAGYAGGVWDRVISFVTDLFLTIPFLLAALAMAPIIADRFGTDPDRYAEVQFYGVIFILTAFGWMTMARLIRGEVLSIREREFVQAARVIGVPTRKILFREILPNLVAPIVVAVSLGLPAYVAAEAGLSYLGIGVTGRPSWGQTIDAATKWFNIYPLYLWQPVIGIVLLVVALNLLGDAIRDALDPKTRR
ncbi:ABC transporter permease [Nocardioides ferulae]|uniref:ABC transporter permease n=1 Tax=Nocardioides ferulae TaxID=2340821 RepID=UPI000EB024DD|nr:ABC transporter permease [Nocardioides ferulae]